MRRFFFALVGAGVVAWSAGPITYERLLKADEEPGQLAHVFRQLPQLSIQRAGPDYRLQCE